MRKGTPRAVGDALRGWTRSFIGEGHAYDNASAYPRRPIPPTTFLIAVIVWAIAAGFVCYCVEMGRIGKGVAEGMKSGEYVFELTADAQQGDFGKSALAAVVLPDGRRIRVILDYEGDELYFARERVEGWARFSELSDASYARYAPEGILFRASLEGVRLSDDQGILAPILSARRWAADRFDEIPGAGSALMRALLIGDRSHLDEDGLYDAMKTIGLAHMVAVSGAHLSTVGAFVSASFARAGIPRRALVVLLCVFYSSYSVFTGLSAPVVRSAVMAGVAVSCIFASRRASPLAALSVCVCILIAIDPTNAVSLSFFLSAASAFGVVVFAGLFSSWFSDALAGRVPTVSDAFGMTAAANLPIFPVTASVFARLPLISPVSNLLATPAFSILLVGGLTSLGIAAVIPDAGMALLRLACMASGAFCSVALALSHIPYAAVPFAMDIVLAGAISVAASAVLWIAWPRIPKAFMRAAIALVAAAFLLFATLAPRFSPDEIVMLDVGQGDAILVRSQGASLLVDTGNQDAMLMEALARHGVAALDGVAITHHDDDHCASLSVLDSLVARGGICLSGPTSACGCDGCDELVSNAGRIAGTGGVSYISVGQSIHVGRFECVVVWPREFQEEGGNADSLCLLVEYDAEGDGVVDANALLTGDAEADQIEAMVEEGVVGHVNVFKAGHHGSKNGVSENAFEALSPEIALISVGADNRYGHPSSLALEALESVGARVFRTDLMGDISCRFSDGGIEVFVQKGIRQ